MSSYFLILAAIVCTALGESVHHFRHRSLIQDALRERLGLTPTDHNEDDQLSSHQMQMMLLPELRRVLSSVHDRPSRRLLHRLYPSMMEINPDGDNLKKSEDKEQKGTEEELQQEAYKRIVTLALNHVLRNLQTVEGGQEAVRWIQTLRKEISRNEKNSGGETTTTETTLISLDDPVNDDANKV